LDATGRELQIRLEGTSPLLMHNAQLTDPDNKFAREIAKIAGKRAKTEADRRELADWEWMGGVYTDGQQVIMPSANIARCFARGGTPLKLGKAIERGLVMLNFQVPLDYDGPREVAKLHKDPKYRCLLSVGSQGTRKAGRVIRCRPMFEQGWALEFPVFLEETVLDLEAFERVVSLAGRVEGLGDGRAIGYGRFSATVKE